MSEEFTLPPGGPEDPGQIERAAQRRRAAHLDAAVAPVLEKMQGEALHRVFKQLDMGGIPSAVECQAVVLELYATDRVRKAIAKLGRRAEITPEQSLVRANGGSHEG